MSTRRARIKAVTSLPPRRKNVDNSDKPQPVQEKDDPQKIPTSPRTPLATGGSEKPTRPTPGLLPLQGTTNLQNKISSPAKRSETPKNSVLRTPKLAEKVSVITSAASIKSIFASPPPRTDSPIRNIASPIVTKLTPKVFKPNTPQRERRNVLISSENRVVQDGAKSVHETESTSTENKSDVPEDYNVPSVPESITDEAVMDGIVPLQTARTIPKPIDLLKNEIISENAEVNFDPIVPLPSPSKVRPKLRPVPRLAPLRRNSVQGSASESEDESRRALLGGTNTPAPPRQRHDSHTSHITMPSINREINRARNDSICSTISQSVSQAAQATSPVKESKHSKNRRQEMVRRMNAMRRRRETVQRETLTMYDLIFYNPTSNPIIPDQDEIKAKEANKKEEAEREQAKDVEEVDDPPAPDGAPVPQIKLGPNGEIILDEKSLVIKQTDSTRKVSSVVREGAWGGGGGRYSRATRTAEWSPAETVRFYRALAAIGTDFSLMAPLFPDRTRRDLKVKFKKEEKVNGAQLDKALRSATTWDASRLEEEFTREREASAQKAELKRQQLVQQKKQERERLALARVQHVRPSRGSKALENSSLPCTTKVAVDDIIERAVEAKRHSRRRRKVLPENVEPELNGQTDAQLATITLMNKDQTPKNNTAPVVDMATISRIDPSTKTPSPAQVSLNSVSAVPSNIESGSLVVLTVNDPNSPSKKMLQTYIAHGAGKLTPIALPSTFLNSVVGYMKKGTPKGSGSPQVNSPVTVQTPEGRRSATPGVIQVNPSPAKRQRHSSYTITQL